MKPYQEAVLRLAEVNGFGVDSAQQPIAEVGSWQTRFLRRASSVPGWGLARAAT